MGAWVLINGIWYELFFIFVVWKYGVVAADKYHLMVCLLFLMVCLVPFSFFLSDQPAVDSVRKRVENRVVRVEKRSLVPFFLIALFSPVYGAGLKLIFEHEKVFSELEVGLQESVANLQMPKIQRMVGQASVGYFGERIAPMIYNNFSYRSTPSTISFVAWNDWLIDLDAEFIRDDVRAPQYLIYDAYIIRYSISRQFWPIDSAKMQLEIFRHYSPVLDEHNKPVSERGRLLLRRRDPSEKLDFQPIERRSAQLNTKIGAPEYFVDPVQMMVDLHHDSLAMLVGFIFKYPIYKIRFTLNDGTFDERLFTPNKARKGFMISPIILNNEDFVSAMSDSQWRDFLSGGKSSIRRVVSFEIRCSYLALLCTKDLDIQFNKIVGLELGRSQVAYPFVAPNR